MRALALLVTGLTLTACAGGPSVETARMPLEILRTEGQAPRMGEVVLEAGGYEDGDPFYVTISFDSDGTTLGAPKTVAWQMPLTPYCRDQPGRVDTVLIGPGGQVWAGRGVDLPAGPDRPQDWSTGYFTGVTAPDLLEAVAAGGRFTVAIRDADGQVSNAQVFDSLTPARRERLFAANLAELRATDPATVPVKGEQMLRVAEPEPFAFPSPRRSCPAA